MGSDNGTRNSAGWGLGPLSAPDCVGESTDDLEDVIGAGANAFALRIPTDDDAVIRPGKGHRRHPAPARLGPQQGFRALLGPRPG